MAVLFVTEWPVEATNAYWQKKKSTLDAMKPGTKVTGLGAALTAAEKAWKGIDFPILDLGAVKSRGVIGTAFKVPADFDKAKVEAEEYYRSAVPNVTKLILDAAATAAKVKDTAALSKATRSAASEIETKLLQQARALRDIKFDDFDKGKLLVLQKYQRQVEMLWESLDKALDKADKFIKFVEKTPTAAAFNTGSDKGGIYQASRGLTVQLETVKSIREAGIPFAKTDPKPLYAGIMNWAEGKETLDPKATTEQVRQALAKFKSVYEKIVEWRR